MDKSLIESLKTREAFRDHYAEKRDPIFQERFHWRAQTFRHLTHLVPGQKILELGAGKGIFTAELEKVSRGESSILALSFSEESPRSLGPSVEFRRGEDVESSLAGKDQGFDSIVALDILDHRNAIAVLKLAERLLKPGGQIIFFEPNPWNVLLRIKRVLQLLFGRSDPRKLYNRTQLYELLSEIGFIRVFSVFNDFVYRPLNRPLVWVLRNLSILMENLPGIQTLAGSILIHAQKPPRKVERPAVSLCEHEQLNGAVSVVVPCHNEEMNLRPLVKGLFSFYGDYLKEVILVNDNSTDKTQDVIEEIQQGEPRVRCVKRSPPGGVGRALKDGYEAATGRYVLSMDCDFQHLLPELRDLFDAVVGGADVAVGSRFSRMSVLLNYPFPKIIANRGYHLLVNILFRKSCRDLTNNLKLMKREVADRLDFTQPGFSVNAETGLQPWLMGYRLKEVPISWINRTPDMGSSSFRLLQVWFGYFWVMWSLFFKTKLGFKKFEGKQWEGTPKETSSQV